MKKILLTILITITSVISYSQTLEDTFKPIIFSNQKAYESAKIYSDLIIYLENKDKENKLDSNNCKTGVWVEYYSNGQLEVKCSYKNGLKNGLCECYYETGELWEVGYFVDDKLEGISITYYKDKRIKYLDLYKNGVEIKSLK